MIANTTIFALRGFPEIMNKRQVPERETETGSERGERKDLKIKPCFILARGSDSC